MIREAKETDCLNLAALSIQVWLHTYATDGMRTEISKYVLSTFTEQYFINLLKEPYYRVLVFIEKNHLLGFIVVNLDSFFEHEANGYEVDILYVQEHFHGKGIGQRLLKKIEVRFGANFWLSTWIHNEKAIGFYKSLGFKDIGQIHFKLGNELHENRVLAYKCL